MSTSVFFIIFIVAVIIIVKLCYIELFFWHCIGSIGTATFYGAAASRTHPPAQPGQFHVINRPILVLLVFVISSMILT